MLSFKPSITISWKNKSNTFLHEFYEGAIKISANCYFYSWFNPGLGATCPRCWTWRKTQVTCSWSMCSRISKKIRQYFPALVKSWFHPGSGATCPRYWSWRKHKLHALKQYAQELVKKIRQYFPELVKSWFHPGLGATCPRYLALMLYSIRGQAMVVMATPALVWKMRTG